MKTVAACAWLGPTKAGLGALVSRLVSAAAAGGFDNGQCLPALSDLMPSGFARLPCACSGACGFKSALCNTHRRSKGRSVQIRKYAPHPPNGRTGLDQEAAFARQMHHDPDVDELSGRHIVDIVKDCVGVRLLDCHESTRLFRKATCVTQGHP